MSEDASVSQQFRKVCGKFATGVTVATATAEDGSVHGMTINSFTSVSLEPPLVLICIDHRVRMLEHFLASGHYGINILAEHQQELSSQFARSGANRFENVDWYPGHTGVPMLRDVLASLECKLVQTTRAGDHLILIGQVLHLEHREGKPLAFFSGAYSHVHPAADRAQAASANSEGR